MGLGLITLGSFAIAFSTLSTLISVIYLGLFLIITSLFEGIKTFKVKTLNHFFLHLFLAVIYGIGGTIIILNPLENELFLTLLLAFFFILSGSLRIIFSLFHHITHPLLRLLNGAITLLLGIIILYQWPVSELWVIGTFVGIDAIVTGWSWVMLSYAVKKIT